jgi:hypothetical protein
MDRTSYEIAVHRLAAELLAEADNITIHGGNSVRTRCDSADKFGAGLPLVAEKIDNFLHTLLADADAEIGALPSEGSTRDLTSVLSDALHDLDVFSAFQLFAEDNDYGKAA